MKLRLSCRGSRPVSVLRDRQGRRVGRALVEKAAQCAMSPGTDEPATWTPGDSIRHEPYESTRSFCPSCSFRVRQRNTTGNPGCPEERLMVKKLRSREQGTGHA